MLLYKKLVFENIFIKNFKNCICDIKYLEIESKKS